MNKITFTPELSPRPNNNGYYKIVLRITQNRKHRRISLEFAITQDDWNNEKRVVRKTHPLSNQINLAIKVKILELEKEYLRTQALGQPITAYQLQTKINKGIVGDSFIKYCLRQIEDMPNASSKKTYKSNLQKLQDYLKNRDLLFAELTYDFIEKYHRYLTYTLKNSKNTVHGDLKNLKTLYNKALISGAFETDKNPWLRFQLRKAKVKRSRLNEEEILQISNYHIAKTDNKFHTRNFFLFCFYCQGIRVSDGLMMRWKNIVDGRCYYTTSKTKKVKSIKLIPQVIEILEYYSSPNVGFPVFVAFPVLRQS